MGDDATVIKELGIENLSADEQQNVLDEYKIQVGAVLTQGLSEERLVEFEAIIDGNQEVIDRWLAEHRPDFKDTDEYRQLAAGYEEDPDKVPADKVYAATLWIATNAPDFEAKTVAVRDQIKQHLDEYK